MGAATLGNIPAILAFASQVDGGSPVRADTGIAPVGRVEWGSHFCHFYRSANDLSETLVPYFRTGLEQNEVCLWVAAEPLGKERAVSELNTHVANLDAKMRSGQISIVSHHEWYALHGAKNRREVANAWLQAKEQALAAGYSALRVTGNTAFLGPAEWEGFIEYERCLREAFHRQKLIALCSYNSTRCDADAVLDVIEAHDFAVARREGSWQVVENSAVQRTKAELVELNANLERIVAERTFDLTALLDHQRLLTAELSHRVKNTVASIQTIVDQTLKRAGAPSELREKLRGRLQALARAHERLSATEWRGVRLSEVLGAIAAPYGDRIVVRANGEILTPRATLNLGLVFHELATNAAKYGALSAEGGMVEISATHDRNNFEVVWAESGGPRVGEPERDGFGLSLIRQLVEHDLRGECAIEFDGAGVKCTLRAPVAEVLAPQVGCSHGLH